MRTVIVVLLMAISCPLVAQRVMKGIIVDSATFEPLPYASIQVKGKTAGTTTDLRGNFGVLATDADTLLISLVGYKRLELPLAGYEASVIRLAEQPTMLQTITIRDSRIDNPYDGLFDEQNENRLRRRIPFYYAKARKDRIKAGWWREESQRVQTYVDVVINDPSTKRSLMGQYGLSEEEYYTILTAFNEKHYEVMYYLTAGELLSFLNRFFEEQAR